MNTVLLNKQDHRHW